MADRVCESGSVRGSSGAACALQCPLTRVSNSARRVVGVLRNPDTPQDRGFGHDTDVSVAFCGCGIPLGAGADMAVHVPSRNCSIRPVPTPDLLLKLATPTHSPRAAHVICRGETTGFAAAVAGTGACAGVHPGLPAAVSALVTADVVAAVADVATAPVPAVVMQASSQMADWRRIIRRRERPFPAVSVSVISGHNSALLQPAEAFLELCPSACLKCVLLIIS